MLLRKDDAWSRSFNIPDIRDWRVVDSNDRLLGFVEAVVIDLESNSLIAVMTGANDRFPADDLDVGDRLIKLRTPVDDRNDDHTVGEADFATYEDAFRDHYRRRYSDGHRTFDELAHAYTFGRQMALDADFAGRSYSRAEEDLMAYWLSRNFRTTYREVRNAVAFAYKLTHDISRYRVTGMEREEKQILGDANRHADASERAGAHMGMGTPASDDVSTDRSR